MKRIHTLKLYGERNSGTNYLEQLLATNFEVRLLPGVAPRWFVRRFPLERHRDLYFAATRRFNLGWKHMLVPSQLPAKPKRLVVCLTRNPYAWLLSTFRSPHHATRTYAGFDDFLRSPWQTLPRERAAAVYPSPVALWNAKHAAYLALRRTTAAILLRYEDLVRDPLGVLEDLSREHGIAVRRRPLVNVLASTRRRTPERDYAFLRAYFAEERWRDELTAEQRRFIDAALEPSVMQDLGYRWLE